MHRASVKKASALSIEVSYLWVVGCGLWGSLGALGGPGAGGGRVGGTLKGKILQRASLAEAPGPRMGHSIYLNFLSNYLIMRSIRYSPPQQQLLSKT